MTDYNLFNQSPIRKLKRLKLGKFRVSLGLLSIFVVVLLIILLSTVSINDAEAIYVRDGDFKIGMAISSSSLFEEDPLVISLFLTNVTEQTQLVRFKGACQATYQILNDKNEVVYPVNLEDTPCNNVGYEEFLFYPQDMKRYSFRLLRDPNKELTLKEGKYKVIGIIDGFGSTEPRDFSVLKRPKSTVKEGELCLGLSAKKCDVGLECKFEGGFPGGAGLCMAVEDQFEPQNYCLSGQDKCYKDVQDVNQQNLVAKFMVENKLPESNNGNFRPDDHITGAEFTELINKTTGIKISLKSDHITKSEAVRILYKIYNNAEPRVIDKSSFTDIYGHPNENYIIATYQLGIINTNSENLFYPDALITRIEALILIDGFENLK